MNPYYEAPHYPRASEIPDYQRTVFLGGSITGAENWQKRAAEKLLPYFTVFNPRRENYDSLVPDAEREQINWEHNSLQLCSILFFYFSFETVAPITLLELGASLESLKVSHYKRLYIAIHPDYKRKNDVVIQTELRNMKWRKNIKFNLEESIAQIIEENK